jgi:cell growth-regulating nucleolar protein
MVSFVCDVCQETLKKPKLDSHKARCRQAVFSCIDCYKTFSGSEYKSHTSCISEVDKYHKPSKLGTFLKPKGEPLIQSIKEKESSLKVSKDESIKDIKESSVKDIKDESCKDSKDLFLKTLKKPRSYHQICKKFSKKGKDFNQLLSKSKFILQNGTIIIQV